MQRIEDNEIPRGETKVFADNNNAKFNWDSNLPLETSDSHSLSLLESQKIRFMELMYIKTIQNTFAFPCLCLVSFILSEKYFYPHFFSFSSGFNSSLNKIKPYITLNDFVPTISCVWRTEGNFYIQSKCTNNYFHKLFLLTLFRPGGRT